MSCDFSTRTDGTLTEPGEVTDNSGIQQNRASQPWRASRPPTFDPGIFNGILKQAGLKA